MRRYLPGGGAAPPLANINADTIRRAEEAVSKLSEQYRDWVRGDLAKLRDCMASAGGGGEARAAAYKEVRHIAHDLRGQGATFGYPLVSRLAQSISQTLKERAADDDSDAVLSAHFDALAQVIEKDVADAGSAAAKEIIATLETAIGRTVA